MVKIITRYWYSYLELIIEYFIIKTLKWPLIVRLNLDRVAFIEA